MRKGQLPSLRWKTMKLKELLLVSSVLVAQIFCDQRHQPLINNRSFTIDYARNTFLKDGVPFRYISGSIHYFRVHPNHWEDRLKKIRSAGLNAIQVYVEWNSHEPEPGKFQFEGNQDLEHFLELAHKWGLLVILRPGPFIDAERDFGGLPFWLLQKNKQIKLRTKDPSFMKPVRSWFQVLFQRMKKHLYHNGGPIIMVQVENEYGSYGQQIGKCDTEYISQLRDLTREHLGQEVLLFATDGGGSIDSIRCSKVPGVYSTVDFGPTEDFKDRFYHQRLFEPHGPLVNSEFYTGWLDHWGYPHSQTPSTMVNSALDAMLEFGANVNLYMVHGGTSFGFGAGSNFPSFQVTPTSYDYDAPISEAGDLTPKFEDLKRVVAKYEYIPDAIQVRNSSKKAYGSIYLKPLGTIFDHVSNLTTLSTSTNKDPLTFEELGQAFGFVLYEHRIDHITTNPVQLEIQGLHDRGYVYVNEELQGILSRSESIFTIPITITKGQKLQILVENQGRICFGKDLNDFKGITSQVKLGNKVLNRWHMRSIPLSQVDHFKAAPPSLKTEFKSMSFWKGHIQISCPRSTPEDTFLSFKHWSKGLVFVNGFNLGRYWPRLGPQETLYLPGPLLKCGGNDILLLEQDETPCQHHKGSWLHCNIKSIDTPQLNGQTPSV